MSENNRIQNIVIVGGGTAGWISAALLARSLGTEAFTITLIESDEIATVGVGEATIPPIVQLNEFLGIDENEFIRETQATFKLGIDFVDWRAPGEAYFHPFGVYGSDMEGISFHHFWHRWRSAGGHPDFGKFNTETLAARENRFARTPRDDRTNLPRIAYAFNFDATLYAAYLRRYSEKRGVKRLEGTVVKINQDAETGFVLSVELRSGRQIAGDFYIDCTGFRGLLIEETLKSGYEDWSRWLPCDRAIAVPCEKATGEIKPYVVCTAREAGWQWRIPLQSRTGNGYVYSSQYLDDDKARADLLLRLDGKPIRNPLSLQFVPGHRKQLWNRNVLAIGLASGFLEPLESTSIHLVQSCLTRFISMMPRREINPIVVSEYNRLAIAEYTETRDFLIAHYKVTDRQDTEFWRHCKAMAIPESLQDRLAIFRSQGHANVQQKELFRESSWFAMLLGQGVSPHDYNPVADAISEDELKLRLGRIRTSILDRVKILPAHNEFIAANCQAGPASKP